MAKTKPQTKPAKSRSKDSILHAANSPLKHKRAKRPVTDLLTEAATHLQQSQPVIARSLAESVVKRLESDPNPPIPLAPALSFLAEIYLELGDSSTARLNFTRATSLDRQGELISAEPFLWLAQLDEEGGFTSLRWFEQANNILRREVAALEAQAKRTEEAETELSEKKIKLSDALCSMAEVYMTDLSLEPDAESKCESLVTEALIIAPDSPSALQTLANVRISQLRTDDAKAALERSLEIWEKLPPDNESGAVPDFATRISLTRLLIEVEMETRAMGVLERLVQEDDQSVEAWYLGGWCQFLLGEKEQSAERRHGAREWLETSLSLCKLLDYEDDRLIAHAKEILEGLNKELGLEKDEDDWENEDGGEGNDAEDGEEIEIRDEDGDAEMT